MALLYDHFSPLVIMQLEDYGFCPIGEGGPFVAEGNIRYGTGTIPVNTHGGNLSEAYIIGMTHVREAVEQIRGTAVNQVEGAEIALVTGGPAALAGERHPAGEERWHERAERARRTKGVFPSILTHTHADDSTAAVLGRRRGGPPRRAALHELRHVPAPAAAVLLRAASTARSSGSSCRAPAPSTASPSCATRWRRMLHDVVPVRVGHRRARRHAGRRRAG